MPKKSANPKAPFKTLKDAQDRAEYEASYALAGPILYVYRIDKAYGFVIVRELINLKLPEGAEPLLRCYRSFKPGGFKFSEWQEVPK